LKESLSRPNIAVLAQEKINRFVRLNQRRDGARLSIPLTSGVRAVAIHTPLQHRLLITQQAALDSLS